MKDDLGEKRKEISELEKKVSELAPSAENLPKLQAQLDAALMAKQEIESKAQIMEEQYMTKVSEAEERTEQLEVRMKELDTDLNSKLSEISGQKEKLEEDMLNMRVNKDKEITQLKEQVKEIKNYSRPFVFFRITIVLNNLLCVFLKQFR